MLISDELIIGKKYNIKQKFKESKNSAIFEIEKKNKQNYYLKISKKVRSL